MKEVVQFINQIFGVSNETSASIVITLLTFTLSLFLAKIGIIIQRVVDRAVYRRVILQAANRFNKQIQKQALEFVKASEGLVFKNDIGFKVGRVQLFSIETFESIGYKKAVESHLLGIENFIFNRYLKSIKTKALDKIWESILSVNYWHNKFVSDTNIFLEKYNLYNENRNNAIESYNNKFLLCVNEYQEKNQTREYEYLLQISTVRFNWTKLEDNNRADICHENLVLPTRKICEKYSDLKIAIEINIDLLRATHEFVNQRNTIDFNKQLFLSYSVNFKNYSRTISKCIQILKMPYG